MLSKACQHVSRTTSRGIFATGCASPGGVKATRRCLAAAALPQARRAYQERPELAALAALLGAGLAGGAICCESRAFPIPIWDPNTGPVDPEESVEMSNWSGTHTMTVDKVFSPESQIALENLIKWANENGQKMRPVGSGMSPNAVALSKEGLLNMVQMDNIIEVDPKAMTITCEAGTRVSQILEELQKHNMTLSNFSSVTEQQIAGWTQTSAHGTGARIPTVDEMITKMTVVTPGRGTIELSKDGPKCDAELFHWMRVGMGTLGVVAQVTLQCVPRYSLHEKTYCTTVDELRKNHVKLLQTCKHVRYMWVPYTDTIVVVQSDIAKKGAKPKPQRPESERVKPLRDLLRKLDPKCGDIDDKNFAELREMCLIAKDPMNAKHVATVNKAEAEFWKLSEGERIDDSTAVLGFECGGSQWVLENCFPCGTIDKPSMADIDYLVELKEIIEKQNIAAASPIEQRWCSRSASPMSPAYSTDPNAIFSWVGVIMYTFDDKADVIKEKFRKYAEKHADMTFKYNGTFHWAKIDLDFHKGPRLPELKKQYAKRHDLEEFRKLRQVMDPNNLFGNTLTDVALSG